METFIICFKIAKKNKGLIYWYDNTGFIYSPCKDLYGEPIMNFRQKQKTSSREEYGNELNTQDRKLFYNIKR